MHEGRESPRKVIQAILARKLLVGKLAADSARSSARLGVEAGQSVRGGTTSRRVAAHHCPTKGATSLAQLIDEGVYSMGPAGRKDRARHLHGAGGNDV